ncbi:Pyridoxine-5'-phosphate oxidase [Orchesella cincta]|uniref:pyridoxal 5'-phosphate synthase n=1 Tax=Orchesella cincta TaxID=48709 RepID=A0A1D2NK98_ORCCI|nr:Pyridoxine-5'-phosphate oxidase [Orchesella cincta]
MSIDIGGMRKAYMGKEEVFTEEQLVSREPFEQFRNWFDIASKTPGIGEPNAMCLATATKNGLPSARMVLLKGYGPSGFKFFTNYKSRKASELYENPHASLNFYWEPLKRCVRIEGHVEKLSTEESTEYFMSRPENSRIGAIVSPQSQPIPSRDYLSEKQTDLTKLAEEKSDQICKPEHWGGYIVIPHTVEFWQGQTSRLHDRIRFRKLKPGEKPDKTVVHEGDNGWVYERLAP